MLFLIQNSLETLLAAISAPTADQDHETSALDSLMPQLFATDQPLKLNPADLAGLKGRLLPATGLESGQSIDPRLESGPSLETVLQDPRLRDKAQRAISHINTGQTQKALPELLDVWEQYPNSVDILAVLAHCLTVLGARGLAINVVDIALAHNPEAPKIMGVIYTLVSDMAMHDLALKTCRLLIDLEPNNANHYVNMATSLNRNDQADVSIQMLQSVLPNFPNNAELWNVLATSVRYQKGFQASLQFYEEAIRLAPQDYRFHSNYAAALQDPSLKEASFRKALQIKPDCPESNIGLALTLFEQGNLKEGFDRYKHRRNPKRQLGQSIVYTHGLPDWDGSNPAGKSILVCNEQGIGDELLFGAAIAQLLEAGANVIIGCDRRLVATLQRSYPAAQMVVASADAAVQGYAFRVYKELEDQMKRGEIHVDYAVPVGDLAGYYWQSPSAIKTDPTGYIVPDTGLVDKWRERLFPYQDTLLVGLCWRSGRVEMDRSAGYFQPADLDRLLQMKNVTLVNTQYGDVTDELDQVRKLYDVDIKIWDDFNVRDDLEDNFALMSLLDVCVGPSVAPQTFAATVGTQTFWLLHKQPWWQFGLKGTVPWAAKGQYFMRGGAEQRDTGIDEMLDVITKMRDKKCGNS